MTRYKEINSTIRLSFEKENLKMSILDLPDKDILAVVTPITENMQVGWDEDNYAQFAEHFSDDMRKDLNIDNYAKQRKMLFAKLGKHTKLVFVALHKNPEVIIVIWRLYCTNRETPALVIYYFDENKGKVQIKVQISGAKIDY